MSDAGNTRAAIARRIREPRERIKWWAVRSPVGWVVTSREAGQVPTETRDGAALCMVIGPFSTRRRAHECREVFR